MPTRIATDAGGLVFHVMNRSARRATIFASADDYDAFERVLSEAAERVPMRLLAYAVMPNHWHLVVWPRGDQHLARYMQWLTRTHAQRWHLAHGTVGSGAVYQGRYRAVPVQTDRHFLMLCRYVERNPARAGLVACAADWRWSSAWSGEAPDRPALAAWPVARPHDWGETLLAHEQPAVEVDALRACTGRGVPYGSDGWSRQVAARLALEGRLRGRGRPRHTVTRGRN